MTEAVLDTNVLVSGLIGLQAPDSRPGELMRRWLRHEFSIAVSARIVDDVERTLAKPFFIRHFSIDEADEAIQMLRRRADLIEITAIVNRVAAHPEDDLVLATAVSAKARYLVTGDKNFQSASRYRGVTILSPARFIAILDATM